MTQTHKARLNRLEQRHVHDTHAPGLLLHNDGGVYSLKLGGETWPSLDAVHAAIPGHDPNNDTIITWV